MVRRIAELKFTVLSSKTRRFLAKCYFVCVSPFFKSSGIYIYIYIYIYMCVMFFFSFKWLHVFKQLRACAFDRRRPKNIF